MEPNQQSAWRKKALLGAAALVVVGLAAYFLTGSSGKTPPQPEASKPRVPASTAAPITKSGPGRALNSSFTAPPTPAWDPLAARKQEVACIIAKFEENVKRHTLATRVRVETPQVTALLGRAQRAAGAAGTGASGGDSNAEIPVEKAPGYVAFMLGPEGMAAGPQKTMEGIARDYFEQFPDAPQVTVALIIGGGIRGRQTFVSNGDGTVRVGGKTR